MNRVQQAIPYALLMAWIYLMDISARPGPVLSLLSIFALLHFAAHSAGFCFAMRVVHLRTQRVLRLLRELVERGATGGVK